MNETSMKRNGKNIMSIAKQMLAKNAQVRTENENVQLLSVTIAQWARNKGYNNVHSASLESEIPSNVAKSVQLTISWLDENYG